jgi:hypothetical protein
MTDTLVLTINQSTNNTSTVTAVGSYTWSINGLTYTQSGTYTYVTTNQAGCPHTEKLVLTITTVGGCNASLSVVPANLDPIWVSQGANDPFVFYYGLSESKRIDTYVQGGVGPYSYTYSTTSGQLLQQNGGEIYLWNPQSQATVQVTVYDSGTGCTYTSSITISVDQQYYCYTRGNAVFIKICHQGKSVCREWHAALNLIQFGMATLGDCIPAKNLDFRVQNDMQMELYPNPNQGNFNVLITNGSDGLIEITDLSGKRISSEFKTAELGVIEHHFDLNHLPQGVYMVQFTTQETVLVKKFVIQY